MLSLSLSLTGEEGVCRHALCLQGCAHPLHRSEREKEKEREREIEREGGRERKRERERERERGREGERVRKRERERDVEYANKCYFLFLKGMTGALAPFSYLVYKIRTIWCHF